MSRYRIEKAEEGTPAVDAYLAAGFEPFAVVSTPVECTRFNPQTGPENAVIGYVNVIWFRRTDNG